MANGLIKGNKLVYSCGCDFNILQMKPFRADFDPEMTKIPLSCSTTWDILADGNTKGIFQLETRLGQQSSKRLKPENIEHFAALGALLRPGCLHAKRDGKSVTDHYFDRKNGLEIVEYFHECLQDILGTTYGEMTYQEQAMAISTKLAGFSLQQADNLRKGIGKKKPEIIAAVKIEFLEGCRKVQMVTEAEAEAIFGWIEKSQRYSFNKSHAVSYAYNGFLSAYAKSHFPTSFFTSYLYYTKDSQKKFDEIKLLINNAKLMGLDIRPPDFRQLNVHFEKVETEDVKDVYDEISQNKVYFGFADIKGIGENSTSKILNSVEEIEQALEKTRDSWSWLDFLVYYSDKVSSTVVEGMVESGALDYFKVPRQKMMFEYQQYSMLNDKEQAWIKQNVKNPKSLTDLLDKSLSVYPPVILKMKRGFGPCSTKGRVEKIRDIRKLLEKPPYSLADTPEWLYGVENARLGVSLTASVVDGCKNSSQANMTCLDFLRSKEKNTGIFIAAQIDEIKTYIDSKDREMAFMTISDNDASVDCVAFASVWEEISNKGICIEDNTVMVSGERSPREKDSFIIRNMWQLT